MSKLEKTREQLKQMNLEELREYIDNTRRNLFSLRLESVNSPVKNVTQFKKLRKDIARALTFENQKVVEQELEEFIAMFSDIIPNNEQELESQDHQEDHIDVK